MVVSGTPAAISGALSDIVVRASSGTETVDHTLTERAPYSLQPVTVTNTQDATYAYMRRVRYYVMDQFLQLLPTGLALPLNETWTTAVVSDYQKENWRRGAAAGTTSSGPTFDDVIGGEIASRRPKPVFDSNSIVAVQHWGQAWQIGSATVGVGRRVQSNTLQKMLGRALHTNILSPP